MENVKQIYEKRQMKLAIFGLVIAFAGAITNSVFQNFNVAASGIIEGDFASGLLAAYVMSVATLGVCEIVGGFMMVGWNFGYIGMSFKEITRTLRVKSSHAIILSALVAGPIATAAAVMAIALCGSTYANCIISLAPVVTAVLGVIFLKEKINIRVIIGIAVCTGGVIIACLAPPEGITNFYVGVAIACICPFAYAIEGLISTHAYDCVEPAMACPLYRMIVSGILEIIIAIVVCVVTGHVGWFALVFKLMFTDKLCMLYLLGTAFFMFLEYNCTNVSFVYVGAIKGEAILWTGTLWSIPVGFAMEAMGILPYSVTTMGIIGAVAVVVGIMLVVAKPSELFQLRQHD